MKYILLLLALTSALAAQSVPDSVRHARPVIGDEGMPYRHTVTLRDTIYTSDGARVIGALAYGVLDMADDSAHVTVTGILPTDAVTITYVGQPGTDPCGAAVYADNTLTIFATAEKRVRYIIQR